MIGPIIHLISSQFALFTGMQTLNNPESDSTMRVRIWIRMSVFQTLFTILTKLEDISWTYFFN